MAAEAKVATKATAEAAAVSARALPDKETLGTALAVGILLGGLYGLGKIAYEQRNELRDLKDALFALKQSDAMRTQRELQQRAEQAPPQVQFLPGARPPQPGRPTAVQLAFEQQRQQHVQHAQQQQPPQPQSQSPPPQAEAAAQLSGDATQALEPACPVNPRLELALDRR